MENGNNGKNKYVGLRYVPLIMGEWDINKKYEPLMIVIHQGNSYTSKTYVPKGVSIENKKYWVCTGDYNAQIEYYRQEVLGFKDELIDVNKRVDDENKKIVDLYYSTTSVNTTKVIGHRGFYYAPENTIESLILAYKQGLYGVECDVKKTLDGEYVIIHDEYVNTTTNGTGKVNELTLSQIKQFDIDKGMNIQYYPGLKIPTLEEWLLKCKEYGLYCLLDVGNHISDYEKFIDIIKKTGMERSVSVLTTLENCLLIRSLNNKIMLFMIDFECLNISSIDTAYENNVGLSYYSDKFEINNQYINNVRYAHEKGVILNAWAERKFERLEKLKEIGVQFVTLTVIGDSNKRINYDNVKHVTSESDYLFVMSETLKDKHNDIPTSNGYFYNNEKGVMYFKSDVGKQGFAYIKNLGKISKGDVVEIYANVNIKNGVIYSGFDLTNKAGNEKIGYGVGEHIINRKFVSPANDDNFTLFLGCATNESATYDIKDGILVIINSMSNDSFKDKLCAQIKIIDGVGVDKFVVSNGDLCTIDVASEYGVYIEFMDRLERKGIAFSTMDVGGDMFKPKVGYTSNNRMYLGFVNINTGVEVKLSDLPTNMYVNVAIL